MKYNAEAREAYRRGARECYESAVPFVDARTEREIVDWLKELDAWEAGDPPKPPHAWPSKEPAG